MKLSMTRVISIGSVALLVSGGALLILVRLDWSLSFVAKAMLSIGTLGVLLSVALRKTMGSMRSDQIASRLVISVLAFAFSFLAAELALRYIFRDITTTADNTSYFARRWRQSGAVRYNGWGFREKDFSLTKPSDTYRVAVVGDSFTFGQGIAEQSRYTNLLERNLNATGDYEVLNFGRPGAETVDHLDFLRYPVLYTEPDFILLQWHINDIEGHDKSLRPSPRRIVPYELPRKSVLFYFLHRLLSRAQEDLGFVGSYEEYMWDRFGDPHSPSSMAGEDALREFINLTKIQGIPLGIVLFPKSPSLDFLLERVLEICLQENITCLDLRDTLASRTENERFWVNQFDSHPNALANRLVVDRLMETYDHIWMSR